MNDNSKEAYANIKPRLGLHHQMILSQLPYLRTVKSTRYGWYATKAPNNSGLDTFPGATCEQIGKWCQMTEEQVRKRMSELEKVGLVERCKEKFQYVGADGRRYSKTIWRIKEHE